MTKPFSFQLEDVNRMIDMKGRVLLASEMGLGKSFQALLYSQIKRKARPVIIVCPASIKWNWANECRKHIQVRAEVLNGTKAPRGRVISPPKFLIINYDILRAWLSFLRKVKPQLIVLDECHYCKSSAAQRTKAVRALCKGVKHVLALGGTPLTNKPKELWNIVHLLRPDIFASKRDFLFEFCAPRYTPWGWDFNGASNTDILHKLLKTTCMIRRLKKDVLKELPRKQRIVVQLEIKNREYDKANKEFISWLRGISPGKALRAMRAQQMVKTGYLLRLVAELKLKSIIEWVDSFLNNSTGKIILFAVHTAMIQALHEKYKTNSVVVDGKVTGKKRHNAIEQFQTKKQTRILIAQVSISVGWNATAANTVAFIEQGWVPGIDEQATDRTHRIGQTKQVTAYHLVARDTIEEKICKIKRDKQSVITATLDGGVSGEDYSAFDQLIKDLRKREKENKK